MKKLLPVFLILCTVLVLALNIFAGSVAGERIAVVKKATTAIDMTSIAKDAAFEDAAMFEIDNNKSSTTNATAKVYAAWDSDALYFYVDIFDPNLTKYVQKMASDQGQTGKTDAEVISLYRNKVFEGLAPEGEKTIYPWTIPAFEIVIDPTNKAAASSGADQMSKQARVGFDGWQMSYIPGEDSKVAYNCYNENRYQSITETQYTTEGKATGYKIKMKFDKLALGGDYMKDWGMISVHAFFYSVNADGSGIVSEWPEFDTRIMGNDNWKATHYSFYRLWDPAVNDAKTREDAEKITEATTTTTTRPKVVINITTKATTTKATTTTPVAGGDNAPTVTTTTAPAANEGGCGSMIGTGSIVLMAAMAAAPMVLLKKKKED